MLIPLLIIILALTVSGFIAFAEAALFSFDREKWEEDHSNDKDTVRSIAWFHEHPERSAAFVRTVRTFSMIAGSFAAGWLLFTETEFLIESTPIMLLYGFITALALSSLYWIFALLIPKAIGEKYSQSASPSLSTPFLLLLNLFYYPLKIITHISNLLLLPFKTHSSFLPQHTSEDKIRAMIDEGLKSGSIDPTEHEILENVLEFNDLKANEVMVPRTEMVAVEISDDNDSLLKEIVNTGHSLVPVYTDSLDRIIGIIHIKDLMRSAVQQEKPDIKGCIRPAYFVPETKMISEILREMQTRGERICIVTDEYGGTEGVLTLEDILSEIVGDFSDSDTPAELTYSRLPDGSYSILGSMEVDDFNDTFNLELPESDRYNTVAGFVAYFTGKILNPGEVFRYENVDFELVKKIKQRMVQFKISAEHNLHKEETE